MSQTKALRPRKRQLGQFLTPPATAYRLISDLPLTRASQILEPSFGDGSFLLPLIEKLLPLYDGPLAERLEHILTRNLYGAELDPALYAQCLQNIERRWGYCPAIHNLVCADFFRMAFPNDLDFIVGNPPFGGTIAPDIQDKLDREFGRRNGFKIKKETYSFFIVKCLDLLKPNGRLRFICSDTFLTINTMQGLRRLLLDSGSPAVTRLDVFSDETKYAMVVLDFAKTGPAEAVTLDGSLVSRAQIALTGNHSWQITDEYAPYFAGPKLGDYLIATSGMTVGANELFVRKLEDPPAPNNGGVRIEGAASSAATGEGSQAPHSWGGGASSSIGQITEPYAFEFFADPITLKNESKRARLGFLSPKLRADFIARECLGETRRNVRIVPRPKTLTLTLPHPDYRFYNKAVNALVYVPPTHAIYWKDDGDAVLTFKKNGNWYLHGVGGQKHFGREGLTWQLISATLNARYLPPGYILDSGAPCAFPREGVPQDELYFILGWTISDLCGRLLKDVINHTKNIQGKDFERLPYPFWVAEERKAWVIERVKSLVQDAMAGQVFRRADREIVEVGQLFEEAPPKI